MHASHVLPWHGIFPAEHQAVHPFNPFLGPKTGIESCRDLKGDAPQLNLLHHNLWGCKVTPNMILVRNYELHLEEKYHVCLFWCFCILDLAQIS